MPGLATVWPGILPYCYCLLLFSRCRINASPGAVSINGPRR